MGVLDFTGIAIGLITFLIIGAFHPLVIKGEYHFGVKIGWLFLVFGIAFGFFALWVPNVVASATLGVASFSSFWSIGEVFEQRKRVAKGWFPKKSGK
ncbi:MAG: DUF4491 family protein [Turicibacter sp.]|nr:DUF4491 family protein [Turicibacter sp.]